MVRVASARRRLALVTPLRLALGLALLGGSFAGDARPRSVGLAFVVGTAFVAFAALADRRALLLRRDVELQPLPAAAVHDPSWRVAFDAALPSTFGVSALAVIALVAAKPILGAVLAGAVAGLGVASAVALVPLAGWEREQGARLYIASDGRRFVA